MICTQTWCWSRVWRSHGSAKLQKRKGGRWIFSFNFGVKHRNEGVGIPTTSFAFFVLWSLCAVSFFVRLSLSVRPSACDVGAPFSKQCWRVLSIFTSKNSVVTAWGLHENYPHVTLLCPQISPSYWPVSLLYVFAVLFCERTAKWKEMARKLSFLTDF